MVFGTERKHFIWFWLSRHLKTSWCYHFKIRKYEFSCNSPNWRAELTATNTTLQLAIQTIKWDSLNVKLDESIGFWSLIRAGLCHTLFHFRLCFLHWSLFPLVQLSSPQQSTPLFSTHASKKVAFDRIAEGGTVSVFFFLWLFKWFFFLSDNPLWIV